MFARGTPTLRQMDMTLANKKVKIGMLLPTRGLLLRGDQPLNMDRVIKLAETVEQPE